MASIRKPTPAITETEIAKLLLTDPAVCLEKLNSYKGILRGDVGKSPARKCVWEDAILHFDDKNQTEKNREAFAKCIEFLLAKRLINVTQRGYPDYIYALIRNEKIDLLTVFARGIPYKKTRHGLIALSLKELVKRAGMKSLSALHCVWPDEFASNENFYQEISHVIREDNVNSFKLLIQLWPNSIEELLGMAVTARAKKCVAYCVTEMGSAKIFSHADCVSKAISEGFVDIARALTRPHDINNTLQMFFQKIYPLLSNFKENIDEIKNEIDKQHLLLYRLNSIGTADSAVEAFLNSIGKLPCKKQIKDMCETAKKTCLSWLPFVAQYSRPKELRIIDKKYQQHDLAIQGTVFRDQVYGMKCLQQVEMLLSQLTDDMKPERKEFSELPKSSNGRQRFAALVEKIALFRKQERPDDEVGIRDGRSETPISGLYEWGNRLRAEVQTKTAIKPFFRHGTLLTTVKNGTFYDGMLCWMHGQADVEATWQEIEDTFEKIMAFDLKTQLKLDNAPILLKEFYQEAIKLIWLIGNTTPLNHGSGTVVEGTWALIHKHHGLSVPLLKKEYPQLDVLDIALPLKYFQENFNRMFEPQTLHPSMRPTLPLKSVDKQHPIFFSSQANTRLLSNSTEQGLSKALLKREFYSRPEHIDRHWIVLDDKGLRMCK